MRLPVAAKMALQSAGTTGGIRKSTRTDNERAKMATGTGVIQGYTGVAAVDAQTQIIMEAQAHGTGSEQELVFPQESRQVVYAAFVCGCSETSCCS